MHRGDIGLPSQNPEGSHRPGRPLPAAFSLSLDPATRAPGSGTVLIGGAPLRLVRVSDTGRRLVARWTRGEPVGQDAGAGTLARRLVAGGLAHPIPPLDATPVPATVVIPVRDNPSGLARLLRSIVTHRTGVAEVVVVDDGSSDPGQLAEVCAGVAGSMPVHRIRHRVAHGPAQARNSGAARATTDLVVFVDSDVEVQAGWLERIATHFADPAVGAVAPRVAARPRPRLATGGHADDRGATAGVVTGMVAGMLAKYDSVRSPLDMGTAPGAVRPGARVAFVPSATLAVRRRALMDIGGFDTGLQVGEDVDLVWRLDRAGWSVRYQPDAVVTHDVRPTIGAWVRQRFRYGTSAAALARRHPRTMAPVRVPATTAATWLALALGYPEVAALVAGTTSARLARHLHLVEHPLVEAARLTGRGHLWAWSAVTDCLRRPWWPLTVAAATCWPRTRVALGAAALLPPARRWIAAGRPGGALSFVLLHLADDIAYGTGVWIGCFRHGTVAPLVPGC